MTRKEYYLECRRLSAVFGEKVQAVNDFLALEPDLSYDDVLSQLWELQDEATRASHEWTSFCETYRGKLDRD
ncbi:hypothetical protein D9M71_815640 [compost metagenome]